MNMVGDDRYTSPARDYECMNGVHALWANTAALRQHNLLQLHHFAALPQQVLLAREGHLPVQPGAAAATRVRARSVEHEVALPVQADGQVQQTVGRGT